MIAAIDCGTNTIKLLVGDRTGAGELTPVVRTSRMVRLGQGVDATGRLDDAAVDRAFAALDEYAAILTDHDVAPERIRFCATSATRDAENADVFRAGVRRRLGVEPEVLTGAEEAALSYVGAVANLRTAPPAPTLVLDIGGGSTETVLGAGVDSASVLAAESMDIGSVRLTERHLHGDPPTPAEVEACTADIHAALDANPVEVGSAAHLVCVAGTALTVGAGALGHSSFDPARLDQAVVTRAAIAEQARLLVGASLDQRRALGYVHPGRADVIAAGALILTAVLERAGVAEVTLSVADILDGIAASISA